MHAGETDTGAAQWRGGRAERRGSTVIVTVNTIIRGYGAEPEAVDTVRLLAPHLLVAHFAAAGPWSQELRCSRAHCASTDVLLRLSITVPCLSQSHTKRALQL